VTELYVLLALLAALAVAAAVSYNRFVRQRNLVEESWRQIDVELRRRHDLVPNLVQTVKAYAGHEQRMLEQVVQARAAAVGTGADSTHLEAKAQAEAQLGGSLRGLMAVAEGYPELRSAEAYQQLQAQLAETEDRIAAGRRFYNGNVRALNTRVESFPSAAIAGAFGFPRADYFELDPLERLDLDRPPQLDAGELGPPALEPPSR
jgi:LemA protein